MAIDLLRSFTIYADPTDYPGQFVVREWWLHADRLVPGKYWVAPTLAVARARIPLGYISIDRDPDDVPSIVETWI